MFLRRVQGQFASHSILRFFSTANTKVTFPDLSDLVNGSVTRLTSDINSHLLKLPPYNNMTEETREGHARALAILVTGFKRAPSEILPLVHAAYLACGKDPHVSEATIQQIVNQMLHDSDCTADEALNFLQSQKTSKSKGVLTTFLEQNRAQHSDSSNTTIAGPST